MAVAGRFWTPAKNKHAQCRLCHHGCVIASGDAGACGVRSNRDGVIVLPFYGHISSAAVDPIEKKPLYHFRPGKPVFSIGFTGCNLKCPFCQNWSISQDPDAYTEYRSPADIVETARKSRCGMIAYTYSEPLVHIEYLLDCMKAARAAGLENVLVTNGHALEEPSKEVLELTDAANVDLKSWNPEWYRSELGGDLSTVRRFLELAAERTHLEVTTLVIPGRNDSENEISGIADFLAGLSPHLPLHLSAYRPMYRYDVPATPLKTLEVLAEAARRKLRYVYLGNAPGSSDTLCSSCGAVLVRRQGYRVSIGSLADAADGRGICAVCGAPSHILPP